MKNEHDKKPVGITDDKLKHILGVANKCYEMAIQSGMSEDEAKKAFMLGWCHDIGYNFAINPKEHNKVSGDLVKAAFGVEDKAISTHGDIDVDLDDRFVRILNIADYLVGPDGKECSAEYRIYEIKCRFGEDSEPYQEAVELARKLGLIEKE